MRKITKKYYLEMQNIENPMLAKMQLSEKEFNKQLEYLRKRVQETMEEESENKIEETTRTYDHGNYTETCYWFTNCCCDTILSKYECKQGYEFKK